MPQVLGLLQTLCSLLVSSTQCGKTAALALHSQESKQQLKKQASALD